MTGPSTEDVRELTDAKFRVIAREEILKALTTLRDKGGNLSDSIAAMEQSLEEARKEHLMLTDSVRRTQRGS
jgi:prefoldin subunit 5